MGPESGESRSAATAMASTPHGADADADDEPAAGSGHERRPATEEEAVERARARTVGKTSVGSVGVPAAQRPARAAGSDEPHDRRSHPGHRARSQETE